MKPSLKNITGDLLNKAGKLDKKNKANETTVRIIQEKVDTDPMSVVDEIMRLPDGKLKLKTSNIDGLDQTIASMRHQLSTKFGYVHGGGDTVVAGPNITITQNSAGQKVISSSATASPLTAKGDLYTFTTVDARLPVGSNGQFLKANSATATGLEWGGGDGTGDVMGPASSTDNAIARFDGITGKLIQNSGILADDSNNLSGLLTLGLKNAGNFTGTINATGLTGNRTYALPDASGTFALTSSSQYKVFYTVGYSDADYIVPGGSVTAELVINQALVDVNALGGGVVYLKKGTYTVSNPVQMTSNVALVGPGIDVAIVKAINNYTPTVPVLLQNGSYALEQTILTGLTDPVTNFSVKGITWDQNGPNKSGVTSDGNNRAVSFVNYTSPGYNIRFIENKVLNSINFSTWFSGCIYLWIDDNLIFGGWSNVYDQNDGIHTRGNQNFFIRGNYIDTQGTGTSGDDAIVAGSGPTEPLATTGGVISHNIFRSGSRGILILNDSTLNTSNITVSDNVSEFSKNTGIKLEKFGSAAGIISGINIEGNMVRNYGLNGVANQQDGLQFEQSNISPTTITVAYKNISVVNNTFSGATNAAAVGINAKQKIVGLKINDNTITGFNGIRGINVGQDYRPVKNYEVNDNTVDISQGASGAVGLYLYGTERGSANDNLVIGTVTGTTYGIIYAADNISGNDPNGVPRIGISQWNQAANNQFYNLDNGIVEVNSGANPNNNQFVDNIFNTITSNYTLLGTDDLVINKNGPNYGIGNGNASAVLHLGAISNRSGTPSATGNMFATDGYTFTDSNTAGSGTATIFAVNSFGTATLAASNTSVSTTNAATLYISGPPVKGTNNTAISSSALYINGGNAGAQTNAYGLTVNAPTGASGNYSARFLGGPVGIGLSVPTQLLDVAGTAATIAVFDNSNLAGGKGGTILLQHVNAAGSPARTNYAGINGFADDATVGAEFGSLILKSMRSGALTEGARLTGPGNFKLGGSAVRGTTEGTNQLVLFNGTAPVGTLTNGASFYAASGEMRVMDAAGNSTLLSPHDKKDNSWIFDSVDTRTGRHLRIDMEKMMRAINEKFGWDFVKEYVE